MIFGKMAKTALIRADLPLDIEHIELAKGFLMDNIDKKWYDAFSDFRKSSDTLTMVPGETDYAINKHADDLLKYSLRGPSGNSRALNYLAPEEFYRRIRDTEDESGDPYIYTYKQMVGTDDTLSSTSTVQAYSTLANKTSGTVSVTAGSKRITGVGTVFNANDVGLRFKKEGDDRTYRIGKYIDSQTIELDEKYRGFTTTGSNYKIGDVGIKVNVTGFVGGQITSKELDLDGEVVQTSANTFTSVTSVSKSDVTGGAVKVRNSSAITNVVATMAPGEEQTERQIVQVFPTPATAETLPYGFYMKHPRLWIDSDRTLIPEKYHWGLIKMTEADLLGWAGKPLNQKLIDDLQSFDARLINDSEDLSKEDTVPNGDYFPIGNYFNKDINFWWHNY